MASGFNLWVWFECIGVVTASGCCCKAVYRYPHNNYRIARNFGGVKIWRMAM